MVNSRIPETLDDVISGRGDYEWTYFKIWSKTSINLIHSTHMHFSLCTMEPPNRVIFLVMLTEATNFSKLRKIPKEPFQPASFGSFSCLKGDVHRNLDHA